MLTLLMIGIVATMLLAQDEPKMPEAWQEKYVAAAKQLEAGAYAKAEILHLEVLGDAEKFGPDDLRVALPLENLASLYMVKRWARYAEAEPLFRRALAIREKRQGPDHTDTAKSLIKLGMFLVVAKPKNSDSAVPLLRRAIAILEKSKGKDDHEIARALQFLGMRHILRSEADEAESDLTRALAIEEKVSGAESTRVADLLDMLGTLHMAQANGFDPEALDAEIAGKPKPETGKQVHGKKAFAFFARSLAIREKVLKPDDPEIADSLYNLGQLLSIRSRPAEGEKFLERWLVFQEKAKAKPSEKQAKTLMMLAAASIERKDWDAGDRWLQKSQAIIKEVSGVECKDLLAILSLRIAVALEAGRFDDGEDLLRQSLDIASALIGSESRDVVDARALMAGRYKDHIEDTRAPVLWHQLKSLQSRVGTSHEELGDILSHYADLLRRTNRVVPKPTEADLAYLKKSGAVLPYMTLAGLAMNETLIRDNFDDAGLAHIARLYEIENLFLERPGSNVTDAGLAHLKGLVNLRILVLMNASITNAGLAHLAGLQDLDHLNLGNTPVGDAGMVHLKGLKNLHKLDLFYTNVTDAGLEPLKGLEHLESLDLKGTRVTQAAVDRLRKVRPGLSIEYQEGPGFMDAVPALPMLPSPTIPPSLPEK